MGHRYCSMPNSIQTGTDLCGKKRPVVLIVTRPMKIILKCEAIETECVEDAYFRLKRRWEFASEFTSSVEVIHDDRTHEYFSWKKQTRSPPFKEQCWLKFVRQNQKQNKNDNLPSSVVGYFFRSKYERSKIFSVKPKGEQKTKTNLIKSKLAERKINKIEQKK